MATASEISPRNLSAAEAESLKFVEDYVAEIHRVLNLVTPPSPLIDHYRFWTCRHLCHAIDGFAYLRRAGQVRASKFLIRPTLEMAFLLQAVRQHPDVFYRIAFSDYCREKQ